MPFRSPQQLQELMLTGVDPHTQQHCSPAEITSILIDECVQDFQVEHEARVLLQRITNKCIGLVDSEEVMGVHLVDQIFRPPRFDQLMLKAMDSTKRAWGQHPDNPDRWNFAHTGCTIWTLWTHG